MKCISRIFLCVFFCSVIFVNSKSEETKLDDFINRFLKEEVQEVNKLESNRALEKRFTAPPHPPGKIAPLEPPLVFEDDVTATTILVHMWAPVSLKAARLVFVITLTQKGGNHPRLFTKTKEPGRRLSSIQLSNLKPSTNYQIDVRIKKDGKLSPTKGITVCTKQKGTLSPPRVHVGKVTPNSIELQISQPADNGHPVVYYKIKTDNILKTVDAVKPTTIFVLQSLQPGTSYVISVVAGNRVSPESAEKIVSVTTPSSQPVVSVIWVSSSTITFRVQPPPGEKNRPIMYQITYHEKGKVESPVVLYEAQCDLPNGICRYVIDDLLGYATYVIKVAARTSSDYGPETVTVRRTKPPEKPGIIKIKSPYRSTRSKSYILQWKRARSGGRPIKRYDIEYQKIRSPSAYDRANCLGKPKFIRFHGDKSRSAMLAGLSPNSFYEVKIYATNEKGRGPVTIKHIKTPPE